MKGILPFALFSLSFFQASGDTNCSTSPVPYADDSDCMIKALTESADAAYTFGKYLCEYRSLEKGGNYENFKATATECIKVMECLGCRADYIFGDGKTFRDILMEISKTSEGVFASAQMLVDPLSIDDVGAKVLCLLIGYILTSDCLQDALKNLSTGLLDDLKILYCKLRSGEANDAAAKFAAILRKAGCAADGQLETGETLENQLGLLGDLLVPLIGKALLFSQEVPVVGDALCKALNPPQLPLGSDIGVL